MIPAKEIEGELWIKAADYQRQKKEWVGLTDEEIKEILDCGRPDLVNIKKAEQKLKEKNT
jgi:hypothetical protein